MTTRVKVWSGVAAFAICIAVYYPFSPAGTQAANMRRASQHIARIEPQIRTEPRYSNVRLDPFTAAGGSLLVSGEVPSNDDVESLRQFIDRSGSPVEVIFHVYCTDSLTLQR